MSSQTATDLMHNEARFRAQVASAVARAMEAAKEHIRDDEIGWRDVHQVATEAAANALKQAFEGDAEIACLRIERDHYKKLAISGLEMATPTLITIPIAKENEGG